MASYEIARRVREVWPCSLRGAPGVLFADRSRLRMGVDAAWTRSTSWRGRLESAWLGEAHRKDPPRAADTGGHAWGKQIQRRSRTSDFAGISLHRCGCAGRDRRGTGKTVPQIALNWLLQRPTVATLVIGARNEEQLRANLGAIGWNLSADHIAKLDAVSAVNPPYPYWHQRAHFSERNPPPTP